MRYTLIMNKTCVSCASCIIITLVSFHVTSHHLHLYLHHHSHISMIPYQLHSLTLTLLAKLLLTAKVILVNNGCRHVPVPEIPSGKLWSNLPVPAEKCWASLEQARGQRLSPAISATQINCIQEMAGDKEHSLTDRTF